MATTTNYSWTTPDDTDLVKDGAAAIRTLGSSADTTVKNLNPGTTAGDIDYYTSGTAKARIAIGTAGQVLQVNSGATAPEWAAPAGGGANWSLLNAGGTALTGAATITVSGISSKDKLMVLVKDCSSANASSDFRIRLNADSGNNYYAFGQYNVAGSTYAVNNFSVETGAAAAGFLMGAMSSNAGSYLAGYTMITGCNASGVKIIQGASGVSPSGGNSQIYTSLSGYYDSATVISSVSIVSSTGNFDAGTIYVYTSA